MPRRRKSASGADRTVQAAPLSLAELAAAMDRIGGFEARPLIAVAVSGGPDSLALALLADRWARARGGRAWGLTVDHGLRPESAAEAETVALWLAGRGIAHEILVWTGDRPRSGLQAAARDARYRLLTGWCHARGVLHLLTGHQREDQIETHLIRRRAGSGDDGLAGMSAVRELPGCRLIRPLLAVPRARLIALLAAEGQPFLLDPSNLNPAFERGRLRLENTAADDVFARTDAYGRRRSEREQLLDALLARAVAVHPAGFAVLDPAALASVDAEAAELLLGRLAFVVGGSRYMPRRARLARLRAGLAAGRARTLGGCRFVPWRGRLLVLRELAAASPPTRLEPGTRLIWDRRFSAALRETASGGFALGYLGQRGAAVPEGYGAGLPRLLHHVLPALWDDAGLVAVPHLYYRRAEAGPLPRLALRPANPLSRAGFTVV